MSIRFYQLLILMGTIVPCMAQVYDKYNDGDFTNNPTWVGDVDDFIISGVGELQLMATAAGESHLVTESALFDKVSWEFKVRLDFNPSGSNLAKIYLVSDQADLEAPMHGYYVIVGDSEDEISLYRQNGIASTYVINGEDGLVASSPEVRIKVIRDQNGRWTLYQDLTGGLQYEFAGSAVDIDSEVSSSNYFGFFCDYTATRADKFYFDDIIVDQLRVDSIRILNDTALIVQFNQYLLEDELTDISRISIPGLSISQMNVFDSDSTNVVISLDQSTPLTSGNFQLELSPSLTLNEFQAFSFQYVELGLDTALTLTDREVLLDFNMPLDPTTVETPEKYVVNQSVGSPIATHIHGDDPSQVILTFNESFQDGVAYEITIGSVLNEAQNSSFEGSSTFRFVVPLKALEVSVLSEDSISTTFNKPVDPESVTPSNFLVNHGLGNPISAITLDNVVILVFDQTLQEAIYELEINGIRDLEGFSIESGSPVTFEYVPLKISSVDQVDLDRIGVNFNQNVDQTSSVNSNHFFIPGIGNPTGLQLDPENDSTVLLVFNELLNSNYELVVDQVQNQLLNSTLREDTVLFRFKRPTDFRMIQINEVMADFSPSVGLPEAEYVELYNQSHGSLELADFKLNGEQLPPYEIGSGEFLVLTDDSNEGLFEEIPALFLTSFDALTNGGDSVILRDQFSNIVDSIYYTLDWYQDPEKDNGGYSLEQVNPNLSCSDDTNWRVTSSALGGTPGALNSIFSDEMDNSSPLVVNVEVLSGDSLQIVFNEPVDPESISITNWTLEGADIERIMQLSYRRFLIMLSAPMASEQIQHLTAMNISDCQGNVTFDDAISFNYDVTAPILEQTTIVSSSEIALTFHEALKESIAETEANYFLAGIGEPTEAILQDTAANRVHLTFGDSFTEGEDYRLTSLDLEDTTGNKAMSQEVAFTFFDHLDTAYVVAPNLVNVRFDQALLGPIPPTSFLVSGGIGNPVVVILDEDNPDLVRLGFDENLRPNNPYQIFMSDLFSAETNEALITPARGLLLDTRSPGIEEVIIESEYQIVIVWNEPLDLVSAFSANKYELEGYGYPIDISVIDPRQIRLTFEVAFEQEALLRIRAREIADINGNQTGTVSKTFIYDQRPPSVLSVKPIDQQSIRIELSESLNTSSVFDDNNYDLEGSYPLSIKLQGPDSLIIYLEFASILEVPDQKLAISGLTDKFGNIMTPVSLPVNTLNPVISQAEFHTDSTIRLTFSKQMSPSITELSNYSLPGILVRGTAAIETTKVKLLIDAKLSDGDSIKILLTEITDSSGNALLEQEISTLFKTRFESWSFIDFKTLELAFATSFDSISTARFLLDDMQPILVQIDAEESGLLRLVFSDSIAVNQPLRLSWSGIVDVYDRIIPDMEFQIVVDKRPPVLLSVESDYQNRIHLNFNEPLSSGATSLNHYEVLGLAEIRTIARTSAQTITLHFDQLLSSGNYQLSIEGITDLAGNQIETDTIEFTYLKPHMPGVGDIIFTELMVDPTPSKGLPELEYIELYNSSDSVIRLEAIFLSDATKSINLPSFDFLPGTYLVLSEQGMEAALAVSGFPSLDNSSDSLTLTNIDGIVLDQVTYQRDWYGDTEKDDGGYSLELINLESQCSGIVNWLASKNSIGGTPGFENSVYSLRPDTESPVLLNYQLVNDGIQINFSEDLDSMSLIIGQYQTDGLTIDQPQVEAAYVDQIKISFVEEPVPCTMYRLSISGPTDCSGNVLIPTTIDFGVGAQPGFNDLIFTEIMADPDPVVGLPNSEYLELFNRTDRMLSLEDVAIRDEEGQMLLPTITLEAQEYLLLVPTNAANQFEFLDRVIGVPSWRSLNNDGEELAIFHRHQLISSVAYASGFHKTEVDGGISLEMRDTSNPCAGQMNWGSSTDPTGGTPGNANSIAESVPNNFGPELLNAVVESNTAIRMTFNEPLYFETISPNQIEILPGPVPVSEVILDTLDRDFLLLNLQEQLSPNTEYTVSVAQVSDCNGNVTAENSLGFIMPEPADSMDIIINEVLFNPREDGVDFVEIHNRSDKNIDLQNWSLGRLREDQLEQDMITTGNLILASGDMLALTMDDDRLRSDYPKSTIGSFLKMESFPVFPNETGIVQLLDETAQVIDAFEYHEDMHLSFLESVDGVSLERISSEQPTQDKNNWQSASSTVGFATPGYQNSQFLDVAPSGTLTIEPKVFIPANFGSLAAPDFTTINYELRSTGQLANVNIYNRNGQQIKNLMTGGSLSSSGFLRWDGTTDQGSVASMGYYLIVFEIYDATGFREVMKETVVVGR